MKKWEYSTRFFLEETFEKELETMGENYWEMVSFYIPPASEKRVYFMMAFFKRPKT